MGFRSGPMGLAMKGTGRTVKLVAKENLLTSMATSMMASGETIRLAAKAFICITTELDMRASGWMIISTVGESKNG